MAELGTMLSFTVAILICVKDFDFFGCGWGGGGADADYGLWNEIIIYNWFII